MQLDALCVIVVNFNVVLLLSGGFFFVGTHGFGREKDFILKFCRVQRTLNGLGFCAEVSHHLIAFSNSPVEFY